MRFRTFVFVAALGTWPLAAGAQTTSAAQQGPTPQQAIESPATHIGATVTWVVRVDRGLTEIGVDGQVTKDRILYEWRDSGGNWTGVMVVAPVAGHYQQIQGGACLIKGTVKAIEGVAGPAGKIVAVVLENVTLAGMPEAKHGQLTHTYGFSFNAPTHAELLFGGGRVFNAVLVEPHAFTFDANPAGVMQASAPPQTGPSPQQVLDSPKDTVGATVAWVVRYRNVIVDMQPDGKIASSRIAYEWRSSSGASAPILIVGPSLQDTRFAGESAGLVSVLHAEPRLLTGTVRGVHASNDADGRATLAIAVDGVTLGPLPISEKHRLGPGTGPGSFSPGQGGSGGGVYAPGQGVSWPEVLKETKPIYPVEAIASKREGSVELEIIITADGRVSDVRITKSLDRDGPFDKAALAAAKQWLFKPGTKGGVPVPTKVSLVLDFKIKK